MKLDQGERKLLDQVRNMRATSYGNQIGAQIATLFLWTLGLLVTGTVVGIWIKLFWLGWVFAR